MAADLFASRWLTRGPQRAELLVFVWETFSALLFASAVLPQALRSPWPGVLFVATLVVSAVAMRAVARGGERAIALASGFRLIAWPLAFLPAEHADEFTRWIPTAMFGLMAAAMRRALYRRELLPMPPDTRDAGPVLASWMRGRLGESAAMAGILGGHLLLLFSVAFLRAGSEMLFRGWWQFLPALGVFATLVYTLTMLAWTSDVTLCLRDGPAAGNVRLLSARERLRTLHVRLSRLNLALWLASTAAGVFYFRTGSSGFREVDAVMQLLYAGLFCWGVAHYQKTWDRETTDHVDRALAVWLEDAAPLTPARVGGDLIRDRMLRAFGWPLVFAALLMLFSSVSLYRALGGGAGLEEDGAALVALVAAFLMLVLAVGGVILRVATELATPIVQVAEAAEVVAEGELGAAVPSVVEPREVARLSNSVERMRQTLAKSIAELESERANLEVKVQDRTRELSRALVDLRATQAALVQGERLASIGELVAGLAHEIGNPLNAVAGSAEPLERVVQDVRRVLDTYRALERHLPAEQRGELEALRGELDLEASLDDLVGISSVVRRATDRTVRIVQNLRNFSRSTQEAVPTNLEHALDETLALLASRVRQSCIQITRAYGGVAEVTCRSGEMNQVFMNLLMNAIHAVESVGDPEGAGERDREIRVGTRAVGAFAEISIEDSGAGVGPELRDRIFDPFFTTKPKGQGTGLGLSISTDLVRKHGGSLAVEEGTLSGARFVVRLPFVPEARPSRVRTDAA